LGGTKPYGFLYSAAQTSQTAGTLCEIKPENLLRCETPPSMAAQNIENVHKILKEYKTLDKME
jgi:hypothetical protein